jgi:hypothetical protein
MFCKDSNQSGGLRLLAEVIGGFKSHLWKFNSANCLDIVGLNLEDNK